MRSLMKSGWMDSPHVGSFLQQRGCCQVLTADAAADILDVDADDADTLDTDDAAVADDDGQVTTDALDVDDADVFAGDDDGGDDGSQVPSYDIDADDADVGDEGSTLAADRNIYSHENWYHNMRQICYILITTLITDTCSPKEL